MTTPALIETGQYRQDGSCVCLAGATVALTFGIEEPSEGAGPVDLADLSDRFFVQRIHARDGTLLAEVEPTRPDDTTVRFVLEVSRGWLVPGSKAADLTHTIVELMDEAEDEIVTRPFSIRGLRSGLPGAQLTVVQGGDRFHVRYVGSKGDSAAQQLKDAGYIDSNSPDAMVEFMRVLASEEAGARSVGAAGLATGGGPLSENPTITVPKATPEEAVLGASDAKAVTPLGLKAMADAVAAWVTAAFAPLARTVTGGGLVTGGGDLGANRVLTVPKASGAEALAGTDDAKAVTPLALKTARNADALNIPPRGVLGRKGGFLGTSITNGSTAHNSDNAYARQAIEMAGMAAFAGVAAGGSVISGWPGAKSAAIKTHLQADILDAGCDIVVLEVGANDAGQGESLADYYAPNMLEMFKAVKAAGRSLFVMTVPPRGPNASPTAAQLKAIDAYNAWLRLVVPQFGRLIDINRALVGSASTQYLLAAYDGGDGVHPNSTGHRLMARLLAAELRTFQRHTMVNVINANNLVSNPFFLGDASSPWFEQPGGTGAAPAYSYVADTQGQLTTGKWREMDFAPGGVNGSRTYAISLGNASPTTWENGDQLAICVQLQVQDVAGNWETIGPGGAGTANIGVRLVNGGTGVGLSTSAVTGRLYPIGTNLYALGPTWLTYTMASSPTPLALWLTVSLPAGANLKVRIGEVGVINLTKTGLAAAPMS